MDGHCAQPPVPHHLHLGLRQQAELGQGVPAANLLDDADEGIGSGDEQESHVREAAYDGQQRRQHHKNQIEKGQGVFPDDLAGGLDVGIVGLVAVAVLQQLRRLLACQPRLGIGKYAFDLPGMGLL